MGMCVIGVREIEMYRRKGAILIDLRDADDYRRGHIPGAISVPVSRLKDYMSSASKQRTLIFYCQHGSLSFQEGKRYVREGYRICSLAGGMASYLQSGR